MRTGLVLLAIASLPSCAAQDTPYGASNDPLAEVPPPVLAAPAPKADTLRLGPTPRPRPDAARLPFPPTEPAPHPTERPPVPALEVIQARPQGAVETVDRIVVRFNQPMVPLASVGELDQAPLPLVIEPGLAGRTRWLDTRTLVFEAPQRLPFATMFKVHIPAGVSSALGAKLERPYQWTFETPAPKILTVTPADRSKGLALDSTLRLTANVPLDEGFLRAASLRTAAGQPVPFQLRRPTDSGNVPPERTAELVPTTGLTPDTRYLFQLAAGWSSAEGPKPGVAFSATFHTYGTLHVEAIRCEWPRHEKTCPPYRPLVVELNNEPDPKQKPEVEITPAVEGFGAEIRNGRLRLLGSFRPETTYRITVKKGLRDVYQQHLARDHTARVRFDRLEPRFSFGRGEEWQVIETAAPSLRGWAVNVPTFRVRAAPLDTRGWLKRAARDDLDSSRLFDDLQITLDRTMKGSDRNDGAAVTLALDKVLTQGRGLALVEVTASNMERGWRNPFRVLVQATDLGLLAAFSHQTVQVAASGLRSGEVVAGARLELVDEAGRVLAQTTSDVRGRAALPIPTGKKPFALIGRHGGNTSILPLAPHINWLTAQAGDIPNAAAFLFTDRGVYRPGEPVQLSALLRDRTPGGDGDLQPARSGTAVFTLRDPTGNEVLRNQVAVDAHGFAHLEWQTPKDATLGEWSAAIETAAGRYAGHVAFHIEEYRTPELKVETGLATDLSPPPAGSAATGSVEASYYFGGPVAQRTVRWTLTRTPTEYTPPNNGGFRFGVERRYWLRHRRHEGPQQIAGGNGTLDAGGRFAVPLVLEPGTALPENSPADEYEPDAPDDDTPSPRPSNDSAWTYVFEASVQDANRQSIAGRSSVLAHRSLRRVGLRLSRSVLQPHEETTVEVVVVELDGSRVKDVPVAVTLVNEDTPEDTEAARCDLVSAAEPVSCRLAPGRGGAWRVVATAADAAGREDHAARYLWVAGGISTGGKEDAIEIIADKASYAPGETAKLLVRSPFPRAKGLLVVGREGVAATLPLEVTDGSALVELPIQALWLPQVTVQAILVAPRSGPPGEDGLDPRRPRTASRKRDLAVATDSRRLHTEVKLSTPVASPREPVTVQVATRDPTGKPVPAQVTVMVVDEAVLALTGHGTPDPLGGLYSPRWPGIEALALQAMLYEPGTVPEERRIAVAQSALTKGVLGFSDTYSLRGNAEYKMEESLRSRGDGEAAPRVRSDFITTPYFLAKLATDASGQAKTTFTLPDNLTQFRVMAIAADDHRLFGAGEAPLTVRLPLQVRPALPRFLNLGDSFTAGAVVDNRSGSEATVVVRMLAANAEVLETHRTLRLAPGESREVRFPVRAGAPGPAKFQIAAKIIGNDQARDVAEVIVPTLIPATAEAFAVYGSSEDSVAQPVQRPSNALPGFGGLEVQLSSTALTGLRDAVGYLADYPHGCTEQLTSQLVPFITLKEVAAAFGLETAADPDAAIRRTLKAIERNRRADGGFGYWAGSRESSLHLTAWVAFVMQDAQRRGLLEDRRALDRTVSRLRDLVRHPPQAWERRGAPRVLAALVFARAGRADVALLEQLSKESLPLLARAWLAEAWHQSRAPQAAAHVQEQLRIIRNAAVETAGTLHFTESSSETLRLLLHSSELTDAIVLRALLTIDAGDPMIDKLARGLSERRRRGHWGTTHANAWAVLAMSDLFARREAQVPDFDARVWLDDSYAGGRSFSGRELAVGQLAVPMENLSAQTSELLLAKQGPGRLYWRIGLRYAPADLQPQALDQGFVVRRAYEPLDPDSVTRDDDGTWRVKAGARVRVRLTVTVPDRRYHIALVDPMPAGFEAENSALATTAHMPPDDGTSPPHWWWSPWTHTELRDDRAQAFAEGLDGGIYEHTWVARATTPGRFIVPPTRAEEMYAPETFGRSAADIVVVE